MTTAENNTIDSLVKHSLKQHGDMIELLRPLRRELEESSLGSITGFNMLFNALQKEMQITDNQLTVYLKATAVPDNIRGLLGRRQSLQEEILQTLRQTIPMAGSVKSLMASEIQSVKNGRKALSGYKAMNERHGGIVNRIS